MDEYITKRHRARELPSCPACGSIDISMDIPKMGLAVIERDCTCHDCWTAWTEEYVLQNVVVHNMWENVFW